MGRPANVLTAKNKMVCEYIIKGDSIRAAMERAGYSKIYAEKQACYFLKHRLIAEYLRKRQEEIARANTIDINYVLRKLSEIVDRPGEETKDKVAALKVLKEALNETLALTAKIEVAQSGLKESIHAQPIIINMAPVEKP